ncbi:E3 ubiquitin ligase family protein [Halobacteria archaeon AArc-dxtr1]|nr:E3 ubiquitin ligase family protein [Halobacteria archaeon AArc-dxtr1]
MFGIALLVAGLGLVAYSVWGLRPAYHVYRGETDDIVGIEHAEGTVELVGTASPIDGAIEAPLTGSDCLAYEYEVEEYQSSGKNSSWRTVDEGAGAVPFRLDDETASVRVDPAGATLALSTDTTVRVDGGEPEPEPIRRFLEHESDLESENSSLDLRVVKIATGNDRKYHERRLDPDGEAYVIGRSTYDVEARETMRDVNAVVEGDGAPTFVVSDSSQDGAAWLLAKEPLTWLVLGLAVAAGGGWLTASGLLF